MSRLTRKSTVVLLAVLGAALLLVSGSRVWVDGTVDDAVLGASRVAGKGSDVAPGVVALALVAGAAALATATSGRVVRRVTVAVLGLSTVGLGYLVGHVLAHPSAALGSVAAKAAGRSGSLETHAAATVWPWLAMAATVLLAVTTVMAAVGARQWQGLSARYENRPATAPGQPGHQAGHQPGRERPGARGERVTSDWDQLSAGVDPTDPDRPGT